MMMLYSSSKSSLVKRLKDIMKTRVKGRKMLLCHTFSDLFHRLHKPHLDLKLVVLMANNSDELHEILTLKNFLVDLRVVLILPDRDQKTVAKAHILSPRFLAYTDSDFEQVEAVIEKMVNVLYPPILSE